MTVETSRCREMHFRNSDVHTLTANYNIADGLSIYQEAGDALVELNYQEVTVAIVWSQMEVLLTGYLYRQEQVE